MAEKYIPKPNQIYVYKTKVALVEVMDNLCLPNVEDDEPFAHIHGKYSRLTINVSSFKDKKYGYFNVEPYYFAHLLHAYDQVMTTPDLRWDEKWEHKLEKLQSHKELERGRYRVCKIKAAHVPVDGDGKTMRSPWGIRVENGSGIKKQGKNGSEWHEDYKCDKDNAQSKDSSIALAFSDYAFYTMLKTCVRYVELWENTMAIPFMRRELALWAESEDNYYQKTA